MAQVFQLSRGVSPVVRGGYRRYFFVLFVLGLLSVLSFAKASPGSGGVKQEVQELSEEYVSEEGDDSNVASSVVSRNSRVAPKRRGSVVKKAAALLSVVAAVSLAVMKREDIMKLIMNEEEAPQKSQKLPEIKQTAAANKKLIAVSSIVASASLAAGALYYYVSTNAGAPEEFPFAGQQEFDEAFLEEFLSQFEKPRPVPSFTEEYVPAFLRDMVPTDPVIQALVSLAAGGIALHAILLGPIRDNLKLRELQRLLADYQTEDNAGKEVGLESETVHAEPEGRPAEVQAMMDAKEALEMKKANKRKVGKMIDAVAGIYATVLDGVRRKSQRAKTA